MLEMDNWRESLLQIQECTATFSFSPPKDIPQHVFTDGACTVPAHPVLKLATWGVIRATSNEVVAMGHLTGVTQSIDRAELTAIVVATRWNVTTDLYVWSDSLSTVETANFIQYHGHIPSNVENYDLWLAFNDALKLRDGYHACFRSSPSHVHVSQAEDPFEAWTCLDFALEHGH